MLKTQEITLFGILNCSIIVAQVRERTLLRKEDYACSEVNSCSWPLSQSQDPNYSFQTCVLSWVVKEAGCHLDWFRSHIVGTSY